MVNEDLDYRTAQAAEAAAVLEQAKAEERGQIASNRSTVTASGGTTNLQIENPSGSGVNANIQLIHINTQFEGIVDVWDQFSTAPSGGTADTPDNLLMDSEQANGSGSMNVNTDVTFTGSNTHIEDVIPSGGPGGNIGGPFDLGSPLIEPEREIVIEVTNQSGSDDEAAITVVWAEETIE